MPYQEYISWFVYGFLGIAYLLYQMSTILAVIGTTWLVMCGVKYFVDRKIVKGTLCMCLAILLMSVVYDSDALGFRNCASKTQETACADWHWHPERNQWATSEHNNKEAAEYEKGQQEEMLEAARKKKREAEDIIRNKRLDAEIAELDKEIQKKRAAELAKLKAEGYAK
jgi:hypothetical protein